MRQRQLLEEALLAWPWKVWVCCCLLGPTCARAEGLLAEYFVPVASSCGANGSVGIFDGLLPSITRMDQVVNFPERSSFDIKRCAWEVINGKMVFNCRGSAEMQKYFAARWTGSILVANPGMYTFEMEVDDGARLTIGYGQCPGVQCADKTAVLNAQFSELQATGTGPPTYGKECNQCQQGIYANCWNTPEGCEPFSIWRLEADGGTSGACASSAHTVRGTRYLSGGTHPLELQYFQRGGAARLILRYSGPDTGDVMLPVPKESLLFPRGNGLRAEWYVLPSPPMASLPSASLLGAPPPGAELMLREDDVDFDKNGPGMGTFSQRLEDLRIPLMIRWIGFLYIIQGGEYILRLESDDGSRIIIGARGAGGERVLISNDGILEGARTSSVTVDMLPGLHPIRVEYFWVPEGDRGFGAVPRPPGVQLFYQGPDAEDGALVTKDRFLLADPGCTLNSWDWSLGMYMTRDCRGECIDGDERIVGDKVCDDGRTTWLGTRKAVTCAAFNFDNYDCEPEPPPFSLGDRPEFRCHVSCPSANFKRRDCSLCGTQVGGSNGYGTFCSESGNGTISYIRCCSAKLYGVEYWGQDCVAFGTTTMCNETLVEVLEALRSNAPRLDWLAARADRTPWPYPVGELTEDCEGDYCNTLTPDFVINPWTMMPTEQRVCPIQESPSNGTACYEGPWEVTFLRDPYTECQDGRYKWNFCPNRKTPDGRPFVTCCSFLYINAMGQGECRFVGISEGTCGRYIQLLKASYASNRYRSISNPLILNECTGDLCNDPSHPEMGCPETVIREHPFTMRDRLNDPPDWDEIPGPESYPGDMNWPAIFIPVGGVLFLCVAAVIYRQSLKTATESPWHSQAAKVIGQDTFIEPEKFPGDEKGHGMVKPRSLALREIVQQGKMKPKALSLDLHLANQQAAIAAQARADEREAAITGKPPSSLKQAAQADARSPSHMQRALPVLGAEAAQAEPEWPEALGDSPFQVHALELPGEMKQQLALQADAAAAQASETTTSLVLKAAPAELQERLDQVYLNPMELVPVATLAATQTQTMSSAPDATPVIAPQVAGTRGRPAAAARFMRQGVSGPPRVAT